VTFHQLKLFVTVARLRSIKAAAAELRTAQPSISRQLQHLAEEVGTSLHRRVGQGIALTPAGLYFAEEAALILSQIERLQANSSGAPSVKQKVLQLTIGGSYGPSARLLPVALAHFRKLHPEVNIFLRTDNRLVLERLLLTNQIELAVMNNTMSHRGLTIEPYCTEPAVAFVTPNHPLARPGRFDGKLSRRIGLIIRRAPRGPGIGESYLNSLRKHGLKPEVIMYCDSPEALKTAVIQTAGVGILASSLVEKELKRGVFKRVVLPGELFPVQTSIVFRTAKQLSKVAREFIELLRENRMRNVDQHSLGHGLLLALAGAIARSGVI